MPRVVPFLISTSLGVSVVTTVAASINLLRARRTRSGPTAEVYTHVPTRPVAARLVLDACSANPLRQGRIFEEKLLPGKPWCASFTTPKHDASVLATFLSKDRAVQSVYRPEDVYHDA